MINLLDEGLYPYDHSSNLAKFDFTRVSIADKLKPVITGPLTIKNEKDTEALFTEVKIVYDIPLSLMRVSDQGLDLLISFFQPKLNIQNHTTKDPVLYLTKVSSVELQNPDQPVMLS